MNYETVRVSQQGPICFLQLHRPANGNAINGTLIAECGDVIARYRDSATVIVVEGLPEVFCLGADFHDIGSATDQGEWTSGHPGLLYDLWLDLATGPYVTIAHVRGRANAGGIGFVAACDVVLADDTARFSLSELLFGLTPACVLPFLIRRVGIQRAHYLTLTTQPISSGEAHRYGLVDAYGSHSDKLLRRHLLRLRRLSKVAIARYKRYLADLHPEVAQGRATALAANREVFSDRGNLDAIARYVRAGEFPWE